MSDRATHEAHEAHEDERNRSHRDKRVEAARAEERLLERRRVAALACDLSPDETGFAPGGMV